MPGLPDSVVGLSVRDGDFTVSLRMISTLDIFDHHDHNLSVNYMLVWFDRSHASS